MTQNEKNDAGFALVELLVAGLLLMLILLGVAGMLTAAYGHLGRSGEQTSAVVLGQQRIEWLRNQAYASSALASGVTTEFLTETYEGYVRVTKIADELRPGLKKITVATTTPGGATTEVVALLVEP